MAENLYKKIKTGVYNATQYVAVIGAGLGIGLQITGLIIGSSDIQKTGLHIALPSLAYYLGTKVGEDQFKRDSDLEKKLK